MLNPHANLDMTDMQSNKDCHFKVILIPQENPFY